MYRVILINYNVCACYFRQYGSYDKQTGKHASGQTDRHKKNRKQANYNAKYLNT